MAGETELGRVVFAVEVDDVNATHGFKEIGQALDTAGDHASGFEDTLGQALDTTAQDAKAWGSTLQKETDGAGDSLGDLAKEAKASFRGLGASAKAAGDDVEESFKGLDDLKDTTGELDSSVKGLGGAVGLVSPEFERLLFVVGEVSGGLEASSRLAKLAGISHRALMLSLAPLTAGLVAAAGAWALMKMESERAEAVAQIVREGLVATTNLNNQANSALRQRMVLLGEMTQLESNREALRETQDVTMTQLALDEVAAAEELAEATRTIANRNLELIGTETTRVSTARANLASIREQITATENLHDDQLRTLHVVEETTIATQEATAVQTANTAATQAATRAAAALAINRQFELEALARLDPAQAIYEQRLDTINAAVSNGLDPERAALEQLAARVQLEKDRAAAVGVSVKQVDKLAEAQDGMAKAAKIEAEAAEAQARARQAATLAIDGFTALGRQLAGEDAEKQKMLAQAQIVISGLVGAARALELGPIAGPIAAAGVTAGTVAALMELEATTVPTMHSGGMVGGFGDTPIRAQGGEAILNRQAVAAIGGPSGVEDLNNTQGPSGGGAMTVNLTYRGRAFDTITIDALRKGGPLKSALNQATRRGRRGRVGGLL
jgi:hypothetical protein